MRLFLVRHGTTELNTAGMFQGQSDHALSPFGLLQAERLRDRLAGERVDAIYSSDLPRALITAQTISSRHQLEIVPAPELREINYGTVEGLTFPEIKERYPEVANQCVTWSLRLVFPEGEGIITLKKRINRFLLRLKDHGPHETVLVVAHGGPLRVMVCNLLGLRLQHWRQINIDLASLSVVHMYPEINILSLLNDTSHLKEPA